MRSKSKSSELTAESSLERSLKRFSLRPLERSRRDAGRIRRFERRIRVRFWRSAPCQGQRVMSGRSSLSFLPSWPSRSTASGVRDMLAPSQMAPNEARKAPRPFPIGFSSMIFENWSVMTGGMRLRERRDREKSRCAVHLGSRPTTGRISGLVSHTTQKSASTGGSTAPLGPPNRPIISPSNDPHPLVIFQPPNAGLILTGDANRKRFA